MSHFVALILALLVVGCDQPPPRRQVSAYEACVVGHDADVCKLAIAEVHARAAIPEEKK